MEDYTIATGFIVAFLFIGMSIGIGLYLDERLDLVEDILEVNKGCEYGKITMNEGAEDERSWCITQKEYESVFGKVVDSGKH